MERGRAGTNYLSFVKVAYDDIIGVSFSYWWVSGTTGGLHAACDAHCSSDHCGKRPHSYPGQASPLLLRTGGHPVLPALSVNQRDDVGLQGPQKRPSISAGHSY